MTGSRRKRINPARTGSERGGGGSELDELSDGGK